MRIGLVAFVVLALVACGKSESSRSPDLPGPPRAVVAPPEPLACPSDTAVKHRPWRKQQMNATDFMIEGQEEWCERSDGVRHGPSRIVYMNNKLAATGAYDNGARTGPWTMWYGDADRPWKASEETWVKDVRQGAWRSFRPDNGKPWAESTFVDGKLDGDWIEYGEDGKKQVTGKLVAGEPNGDFTRTRPDGTTTTFQPDKKNFAPKPIGSE